MANLPAGAPAAVSATPAQLQRKFGCARERQPLTPKPRCAALRDSQSGASQRARHTVRNESLCSLQRAKASNAAQVSLALHYIHTTKKVRIRSDPQCSRRVALGLAVQAGQAGSRTGCVLGRSCTATLRRTTSFSNRPTRSATSPSTSSSSTLGSPSSGRMRRSVQRSAATVCFALTHSPVRKV